MGQTLDDVKDEALRLIKAAQEGPLSRQYKDADFVTDKEGSMRLPDFFERMGYVPNKTFNTLSGDWRQLYYDPDHDNRQIDIFISEFSMCHKIPLEGRLDQDDVTIPLAELFLTKAQIVELNRKDLIDMMALLLDHPIGPSDEDTINSARIAELCAADWGLYTTLNMNFDRILESVGTVGLDHEAQRVIRRRILQLQDAIEAVPKSTKWKMRARVGKRVRWYELPEEVQRT